MFPPFSGTKEMRVCGQVWQISSSFKHTRAALSLLYIIALQWIRTEASRQVLCELHDHSKLTVCVNVNFSTSVTSDCYYNYPLRERRAKKKKLHNQRPKMCFISDDYLMTSSPALLENQCRLVNSETLRNISLRRGRTAPWSPSASVYSTGYICNCLFISLTLI